MKKYFLYNVDYGFIDGQKFIGTEQYILTIFK